MTIEILKYPFAAFILLVLIYVGAKIVFAAWFSAKFHFTVRLADKIKETVNGKAER